MDSAVAKGVPTPARRKRLHGERHRFYNALCGVGYVARTSFDEANLKRLLEVDDDTFQAARHRIIEVIENLFQSEAPPTTGLRFTHCPKCAAVLEAPSVDIQLLSFA